MSSAKKSSKKPAPKTAKKPAAAKPADRMSVSAVAPGSAVTTPAASHHAALFERVRLAQLLFEKCELLEARRSLEATLQEARESGDTEIAYSCLVGLLKLASEARDFETCARIEQDLDELRAESDLPPPPEFWYAKGLAAKRQEDLPQALRLFLRLSRSCREDEFWKTSRAFFTSRDQCASIAWIQIAGILRLQGKLDRALKITEALIRDWVPRNLPGVNARVFYFRGRIAETYRDFTTAQEWYQRAYGSALSERLWHTYIYVLLSYAILARKRRDYVQAYQYLEHVERAATGPEFGNLAYAVEREKRRLQGDAVDLLIDSRKCQIKTREQGVVSLGKQYILLGILEALSEAHQRSDSSSDDSGTGVESSSEERAGLSKAEIIRRVWGENYRPESHDNKLYYNINRLRKLIEPDMRKPRYLLNWREGYRLAPGLRVHHLTERAGLTPGMTGISTGGDKP